jgi:hypothetical protein
MTPGDGDAATRVPGGPRAIGSIGREILARLLELTPPPPQGVAVDQLLACFEAIVTERAAILAGIVPPLQLIDADRPLLVELERRQTAWHDALAAAQRTVGEQRCGAHQLRAYAAAF